MRDRPRFVGAIAVVPFAQEVARISAPALGGKGAIGEATGTTGGFALFCAGVGTAHPDIVFATRDMLPAEREACAAHGVTDVMRVTLGYGALVVAARRDGSLAALTAQQLWLALAHEVPGTEDAFRSNPYQRWSEIDPSLPDAPIDVIIPSSDSGQFEAFDELVMQRGCRQLSMVQQISEPAAQQRFCTRLRRDRVLSHTRTDADRIEAMLEGAPGRIAITELVEFARHREAVRAVTIDGTEPAASAIADGRYPLGQKLLVFIKTAHREQIKGLDAYLRALFDERAIGDAGYLLPLGLVSLPAAERAAQRAMMFEASPR